MPKWSASNLYWIAIGSSRKLPGLWRQLKFAGKLYFASTQRYAMDMLTLSQADTRRLEKLAQAAGRSPRSVLKHVLRDGFEATEHAVLAVTSRMQTNQRMSHNAAMQQLDQMIQSHGRSKKKAA